MRLFILFLLLFSGIARASEIVDATGRTVSIADRVTRVLPADPSAAVLLMALAPDLMLGFPGDLAPEARSFLPPQIGALPRLPPLTDEEDVTEQARALKPDLIVVYGEVTPARVQLAKQTQERLEVPTILLDGALERTPRALRMLGAALHRDTRGEVLARLASFPLLGAENLPSSGKAHSVVYVRGFDALTAVAPGVGASEAFTLLHWRVLAPPGVGEFRPVALEQIAALDPDELIFTDPRMRRMLTVSDAWRALRAVREKHAYIAPGLPFGWVEAPPSLNRLLGMDWLWRHGEPAPEIGDHEYELPLAATQFYAVFFGHPLSNAQLESLVASARPVGP